MPGCNTREENAADLAYEEAHRGQERATEALRKLLNSAELHATESCPTGDDFRALVSVVRECAAEAGLSLSDKARDDLASEATQLCADIATERRAAEVLLDAIAAAREEGEDIPDWLGNAEDDALAMLEAVDGEGEPPEHDPENIYDSPTIRQSIEEDRK